MIYNGDADGQDICSLADDLVNTTVFTYPLKQKARFANKTLRTIWSWVFEAYGGWQFDDSNYSTTFPEAFTDLQTAQSDYDLPVETLTIRSVEAKSVNGTFYPLVPITEEAVIQQGLSMEDLFTSTGQPIFYKMEGSSVVLFPAPNYTQASSLKLTLDRESVSFASTDTTKQPGINSQFHEMVAVGMAMEKAKTSSMPAYASLRDEFFGDYKTRLQDFYSKRFQEKTPAKIEVFDSLRIMS